MSLSPQKKLRAPQPSCFQNSPGSSPLPLLSPSYPLPPSSQRRPVARRLAWSPRSPSPSSHGSRVTISTNEEEEELDLKSQISEPMLTVDSPDSPMASGYIQDEVSSPFNACGLPPKFTLVVESRTPFEVKSGLFEDTKVLEKLTAIETMLVQLEKKLSGTSACPQHH